MTVPVIDVPSGSVEIKHPTEQAELPLEAARVLYRIIADIRQRQTGEQTSEAA